MTSNRDYWSSRSERRLLDALDEAGALEKRLAVSYRDAAEAINDEIAKLYGRYATENALSYTEAMRYIQGNDFRKWRMSLQDYVDLVEQTGSARLKLELETLAMRSRITRLESLMTQVKMQLVKVAVAENRGLTALLTNAYKRVYYRGIFEYQKRRGYLTEFSFLDDAEVNDVIRTPWAGSDFSSRIWKRADDMTELLRREITTAAIQGKSYQGLAKKISQRMGVSYSQAKRLVQTETAYVVGQAELRHYREIGAEDYEYLATLDTRTSSICQKLDGRVFPVEDAVAGVNYPPMHAHCRSTTVPYFDDEEPEATRIARNATGENIKVPASMKYEEWYNEYVDGYVPMKDIQVPKSLGARASADKVRLPDGEYAYLAEGTKIKKVVTFAGKGTKTPIREAERLSDIYGVPAEEFKKVRGEGLVDLEGVKSRAELHWYEADGLGRVKMKVKRWF